MAGDRSQGRFAIRSPSVLCQCTLSGLAAWTLSGVPSGDFRLGICFTTDQAKRLHVEMRLELVGGNPGAFEARIIVVKLLRACGGCLGARRR